MRISDWSSDVCSSDLFAAVDVLLRNATIYFSMISGIIYARIFCSRPYAQFMKARLVNTGVPYLAITAIFTTLLWLRSSSGEAGNKNGLARVMAIYEEGSEADRERVGWFVGGSGVDEHLK